MNGESKSVICDAVEQLYFGSTLMTSIFVSELITVIISLALAALLVFAISITGALHFNVRLLLICVCAASIISNIGNIFAQFDIKICQLKMFGRQQQFNVRRYLVGALRIAGVMISSVFFIGASFNENVSERCNELTFSTSKCVALRRVQSSGALVITASTIFLALERLIATCCFRSYENGGRKSIGFVLTFLLVSIPVGSCKIIMSFQVGLVILTSEYDFVRWKGEFKPYVHDGKLNPCSSSAYSRDLGYFIYDQTPPLERRGDRPYQIGQSALLVKFSKTEHMLWPQLTVSEHFLQCVTAAPASLHAPPATHAVYPYCAVAFYNPRQSRDISFALFAVQMAAALIFAALWYQNVKQTVCQSHSTFTLLKLCVNWSCHAFGQQIIDTQCDDR
ncbi:unnamed protein product [Toxocara canis]|uniref:G protein-coupled receptor n=1 Tax=Toxocara canis TaxID=6265 RepID=A0A183UJC4_TOXCA|nr:unnamed protein product [Toxocara canis]